MTRSNAEEFLLDAGWMGIMFRDLTDRDLFKAARKEMVTGHEDAKRLRATLTEIQAEAGSSTRVWKLATDALSDKEQSGE